MARAMVKHACEVCGKIRMVSPDKIAKGLQRYCRQCQGPVAATKRREAMIKRGGPRAVTYEVCRECSRMYLAAAFNDNGYCTESCLTRAQGRGYSFTNVKRRLDALWTGKGRNLTQNREHWVQQKLI